jgi:hypothetical protein
MDALGVFVAIILCLLLGQQTYSLRDTWPGLPPAPGRSAALINGFGDVQLSYRAIGLMLQNAGDSGGRITNIQDYEYSTVKSWLWLTYALDPRADYVPSLAAYYFGATPKADELRQLIDYLATVGDDPRAERWRWLAHAVYLARFHLKDQEAALALANRLAAIDKPDMPIWTKQMPAFVMAKVGQKQAARDLMLTIAATDAHIDSAEINYTCWYIGKHLREPGDGLEENPTYRLLCSHSPDMKKGK